MVTNKGKPDKGKVRVFVYGTLKKGQGNHDLLQNAGGTFLGFDALLLPNACFLDMGGFPAMCRIANTDLQLIRGEVWYGDQNILNPLDQLEGYPHFFDRHKERTALLDRNVWVYNMKEEWVSEGEEFMRSSVWNPKDAEKTFWKGFVRSAADKSPIKQALIKELAA